MCTKCVFSFSDHHTVSDQYLDRGKVWERGYIYRTSIVPLNAGNYRSSLSDATQARKVKPGHMKALVRGALACVQLERFGEGLQWCDEGLRVREGERVEVERWEGLMVRDGRD